MQPHKLAPHLQAALNARPYSNLLPVKVALEEAINFLLAVEPTELDLKNPDCGIPYALEVSRKHDKEEIKAACELLRICLHAIEQGKTAKRDRNSIPFLLSSLVGFVPDKNKRAARKPRPNARKHDDLDDGIIDALRALPDEATWKDILNWLDRERVIYDWDNGKFTFTVNVDDKKTLTKGTFMNRVTKIKNM